MFKTRRGTRSHRAQQTNNVRADDPVRPQNQNAITLIALVITIIVLLILAGVALSLVLGENGITERAVNSRKMHNISSAKEKVELEVANLASEYYQSKYINGDSSADSLQNYIVSRMSEIQNIDNFTLTTNANSKTIKLSSTDGKATAEIELDGKVRWKTTQIASVHGSVNSAELQNLRNYFVGNDIYSLINWENYHCIPNEMMENADEITELNENICSENVTHFLFKYNSEHYLVVAEYEYNNQTGIATATGRSVELLQFDSTPLDYLIGEINPTLPEGCSFIGSEGLKHIFEYDGVTYELYQRVWFDSERNEECYAVIGFSYQASLILDESTITFGNETSPQTLTASVRNISGNITWSIEDSSIATISSTTGNTITVTPVAGGYTKITATCGEYSKECDVVVFGTNIVTNPYTANTPWVVGWTCDSGGYNWSDDIMYSPETNLNGDLIARLYELNNGKYHLVIEAGSSALGDAVDIKNITRVASLNNDYLINSSRLAIHVAFSGAWHR